MTRDPTARITRPYLSFMTPKLKPRWDPHDPNLEPAGFHFGRGNVIPHEGRGHDFESQCHSRLTNVIPVILMSFPPYQCHSREGGNPGAAGTARAPCTNPSA